MANNEKLALRSWLFKIEKFWTHTLKPAGNRLQTREVALRMNRCFFPLPGPLHPCGPGFFPCTPPLFMCSFSGLPLKIFKFV